MTLRTDRVTTQHTLDHMLPNPMHRFRDRRKVETWFTQETILPNRFTLVMDYSMNEYLLEQSPGVEPAREVRVCSLWEGEQYSSGRQIEWSEERILPDTSFTIIKKGPLERSHGRERELLEAKWKLVQQMLATLSPPLSDFASIFADSHNYEDVLHMLYLKSIVTLDHIRFAKQAVIDGRTLL